MNTISNKLKRAGRNQGFSLIEIMVVMAVMAAMMAVSTPMVRALKGSGDFAQSASQISGAFEQSRAYAMANNTYVYVGLTETANSGAAGQGRIVLVIMASKDGTRGYDLDNPSAGWKDANNLALLSKPVFMANLHMAPSSELTQSGSLTGRPALGAGSLDLGSTDSTTTISKTLLSKPYTFSKVIQFDPQGVARVQTASNNDEVPVWIELGLQSTIADAVKADSQQGAIQIAGVSGSVRVYRP